MAFPILGALNLQLTLVRTFIKRKKETQMAMADAQQCMQLKWLEVRSFPGQAVRSPSKRL
jgi:hypothetical protein